MHVVPSEARGIGEPWARVSGNGKAAQHGCWELNLGLQTQLVLLSAAPASYSLSGCFLISPLAQALWMPLLLVFIRSLHDTLLQPNILLFGFWECPSPSDKASHPNC